MNGAACVSLPTGYSCSCSLGWTGPDCSVHLPECDLVQCQNGRACVESTTPGGFSCVCPPQYAGALCQLPHNPCDPQQPPCQYNSTCMVSGGGEAACQCRPGLRCEMMDGCLSQPCRNSTGGEAGPPDYRCGCPEGVPGATCRANAAGCVHGSCIDTGSECRCCCEPGWTGDRCDTAINECKSNPCLNAASCIDLIAEYACVCQDGYTGMNCEVDVDMCRESLIFPLCRNGGLCLDGPGSRFTCSCPAGFTGTSCEVEVNECDSDPCFNGAVCQDLVSSYCCHCQPGWTGLRCDTDMNECLLEPCEQGLCIQNLPGHGYSCLCRPGFVGRHCEYNYNDCLPHTCPPDHHCLGGMNNVTCIPIVAGDQTVTLAPQALWNSVQTSLPSLAGETETLREATRISGYTYAFYSGDSVLEFKVTDVTDVSISLRFESPAEDGTLLYADGGSDSHHSFFMQLFIDRGVIQYALACGAGERPWRMNTTVRICAGTEYTLHLRQQLSPCEVEMTVSGHRAAWSQPSSSRSGPPVHRAAHLFVGGVPFGHTLAPGAEPITNYTGCIEITELIQPSTFLPLRAVSRCSVEGCRNTPRPASPTPSMVACDGAPCLNGAPCRALRLRPGGAASFACDCPLYFSGRLCERDTPVFFPSFHGDSYLELPPLSSLLRQDGAPSVQGGVNAVTLYLTLKSESPHGTLLFSQEPGAGQRFLHVFLVDGRATLRLRCSRTLLLTRVAAGRVSGGRLTPVVVRYTLPASGGLPQCTAEIEMASGTEQWNESPPSHPGLQVELGPIFLGGVPAQSWLRDHRGATGFVGCIGVLQVNDREVQLVKEAVKGRNIRNCLSSPCQQHPCRNGGTCVSDVAGWSCRCPPLFAGRLCQLSACMRNPCLHGGACVPRPPSDTVCLCPYGRAGLLCQDAVNISRPSFGGTDRYGYSSFVAYASLPDSSSSYEFSLKLTFADTASSFRDGLILFAGQKGLGVNGDDFLALGVWRGRIIHRFNLGSGVGTIVSAPLSQKPDIHTVHFGRSLRTGWLKVDNQRNRTGSSPGPLVGLNTFSWLYVGGFSEHTPELLPPGVRFRSGFQGCIFDLLLRTRRGARLQPLEGQPILGRSVGQCGVNPCALVRCQNGGTCLNSTSSVYCQCPSGWKGALCSETMSACDTEHVPPPSCAHGSTCIPLLDGYTCQCPLGTTGQRCQQALAISDPFFNGTQSSWMSFPLLGVKHRTEVELQFQTLSPEGVMFYTAQHPSQGAGDFFSLSLTSGFMQLRYNLGDRTVQLQSANGVDAGGGSWHTVRAGRQGTRGYLILDGVEERLDPPPGMAILDVASEMFVGGVPTSDNLPADAVEGEPIGFTGCIRELVVNGHQLDLSETGALDGANVGDCDGTACGFHVCRNGGHCTAVSSEAAVCTCPPLWTGPTCSLSSA
nr:protein eyes shut homolog [Paramormyrops kingsleyae]